MVKSPEESKKRINKADLSIGFRDLFLEEEKNQRE